MKVKYLIGLIGCLISVLILLISCLRQERNEPVEDPLILKISGYLDWEGENGFSGTVLVKIPGQQPLIRSYGFANEEQMIPNSPEVVYDIGSITKQFTAAAILKLEMMGRLSVMDSIGKYLPELSDDKKSITFHQLLIHTSGLPFQIGANLELISREEVIKRISEAALVDNPGNSTRFSHAGYNLLGVLIEKISGMSYEAFLEENLLRPAGMRFTGYRIPQWPNSRISHCYRDCKDWGKPTDSGWNDEGPSWNQMASVGMLSTVLDLYSWHEALLKDDILTREVKERFYKPHITDSYDPNRSAAYGWMVIKSARNTNVIAHFGTNGKYYSDFLRYLGEDVTIILLANKFRMGNQSMTYEIAKCIFRDQYRPQIRGQKTVCLDSLPDNRLGILAGRFTRYLGSGSARELSEFIDSEFATHFVNKYSKDYLINTFTDLHNKAGEVTLRQVRITDNRFLEMDLVSRLENKDLYLRLFFDENEDYKIRGISFDFADE